MGKNNKINICVTGANGQLGQEFAVVAAFFPEFSFVFVSKDELDISIEKKVNSFFDTKEFTTVLNCAAYTNVEKAESEQSLANMINGEGAKNLAIAAKKNDFLLIHFSTDYVFAGDESSAYSEAYSTKPINAYGKSKLLGEENIIKINPNFMIFRVSWMYSSFGNNFVKTMIRLAESRKEISVVNDQIGAPTYARDLAFDILALLEKIFIANKKFSSGIYHYCNEGQISWKGFAEEIFKIKKINCKVNPILTEDYPTEAKRPLWSVLNTNKINTQLEMYPSDWQDALKECLKEIKD